MARPCPELSAAAGNAEAAAPDADPSYVAGLFIKSPKLPIRFYLDAGSLEPAEQSPTG
jgi:hypothetical protein